MNKDLFERSSVPKSYMSLAIPMVLSSVLMLVYNMVDMFFVAQTGVTDLVAGVSLCAPIFTFLVAMGDIFGLGGSSVISRLFGANRYDDGKRMSVFSLLGPVVAGIVIALLLTIFQSPLLKLLGASADTMAYAKDYARWISLGAPFIIFALAPANLLRTEGHATLAMTGSIIGSIVNIIFDPICIFTLNMGAAGAAIATVIGNIFAGLFYIYVITRVSENLSLSPFGFHISVGEVKSIMTIGIPSSITNIMSSLGVIILNRALVSCGSTAIAAMGIAQKVLMIAIMMMVSGAFGGQPLYGYLYGAKNKKRLKEVIRFAYMLVCGTGLVMTIVLSLLAPQFVSLFMNDATIVKVGAEMMRRLLITMPVIGITLVTTTLFQSTGKATGAFLLSAGRQGYLFVLTMTIMSRLFGYQGVLLAQPAADVLTALLAITLFKVLLSNEISEKKASTKQTQYSM